MDVRMKVKTLTPSMQHGQETDCRTQMLGIGGNR